jgi:two-component system chemotaxis sensor kinase CheA
VTSDRYTFSEEDIKLFLDETLEMLEVLEEEIIKLEEEGEDAELLQDMFRIAHTVKGSAGTIGHIPMSNLAHSMEDVFSRLRDGELTPEQGLVNVLLDSLDALKNMADEVTPGFQGEKLDIRTYVTRLEAATSKIAKASEASALYEIFVKFYEDTAMPAVRALQVLQVLDDLGTIVESQPSVDQVTQGEMDEFNFFASLDAVQSVTEADIIENVSNVPDVEGVECRLNGFREDPYVSERATSNVEQESDNSSPDDSRKILGKVSDHAIRVDVEAFDRLVRIASEMAIEQARLVEMQRRFSEADTFELELVQGLEQVIGQMSRLSTELQEEVMKARMTPLAHLFRRFPRMVRDISAKLGKQVEFIVEGEDTELDRALIDEVADPIIHLLRNSVGHGIEPPDKRLAAGKPEAGRVRLGAGYAEDRVVIIVEDDGGGIDSRRVRESAVRKGIITNDEASSLSEEEVIELLFQPGFSTAIEADDVSGRGVGLDIVRSNIAKLGGTVRLKTRLGEGTVFTVSVPLTLAVFRALLVTASGQRFVIPLSGVVEVAQVPVSNVKSIGTGEAIILRDRVLPIFNLNRFAVGSANIKPNNNDDLVMVVVRYEDSRVGIIVDSLLGEQEVVIKSLGVLSRWVTGFLGASVLGDGRIALILDIARIIEKAVGHSRL